MLQLYQALHPEDKNVTKADLEYVTLQNIMINADHNDLGFLIGNRLMILVEAQSTGKITSFEQNKVFIPLLI